MLWDVEGHTLSGLDLRRFESDMLVLRPIRVMGFILGVKTSFQTHVKRCVDIVCSTALIVLFLPLFAFLGFLVLADDGRPIIYRRRVLGQKGEFDAFKFRTMRRDADRLLATDPILRSQFERNFKLKNDPRLTRSGSCLRRLSLDELPQLFNVLKGQMSLVGPRMITASELSKYGSQRDLLLRVKPGITGYWQVNGRQEVSYEERVQMDILYIQNWSLLVDLKILLLTPLKVFKREGAY
jgi:lipopolysaccharide/colanic/teichoic acid biosynthesis glycosyltransferase